MTIHKKISVLLLALSLAMHGLQQPEKSPNCVQLAHAGKVLITFNNAQKSLELSTLGSSLETKNTSFVMLPSLLADNNAQKPRVGSAMKTNRTRDLIAIGYIHTLDLDIIDLTTQKPVQTVKKEIVLDDYKYYRAAGISWSDDNNLVAVHTWKGHYPARVIDRRTGKECFTFAGPHLTAVIDPQGKQLLTGYAALAEHSKALVHARDIASGNIVNFFENSDKNSIASTMSFSHNGFLGVGWSPGFSLRDATTYEERSRLTMSYHTPINVTQAFNKEGTYAAIADHHTLEIRSVPDLTLKKFLSFPEKNVDQLDWDEDTLAAACAATRGFQVTQAPRTWHMPRD